MSASRRSCHITHPRRKVGRVPAAVCLGTFGVKTMILAEYKEQTIEVYPTKILQRPFLIAEPASFCQVDRPKVEGVYTWT